MPKLKNLSKDYGFTLENLTKNLRDYFVCSIVNDVIRQNLFTEDDTIMFDKV